MSIFSNFFHVKEAPILSMMGFGGGGTGLVVGGLADLGPIQATGGDSVTTPGDGYKYHIFNNTSPATFAISGGQGDLQVMCQGGGGGGGGGNGNGGNNPGGSGGGGGGTAAGTITFAGAKNVPVVVGARGNSGGNSNSGNSGGTSTFTFPGIATVAGGGGGGGSNGPGAGTGGPTGSTSAPNPAFTSLSLHTGQNANNNSGASGGPGGQAGGDPQASAWWYPYIQPAEGGSGAPHSGNANSGSNYGGGGGGGTGSWDGGAGQPGANGAQGRVVVRYLVTNP